MIPIFKHDCSECQYLGVLFDRLDLYSHKNEGEYQNEYIVRYGNEANEYFSPFIANDDLEKYKDLTKLQAIDIILLKRRMS